MKPHLSLHVTKKGEWWVSGHNPGDRGYTISSTLNYRTSPGAINAARMLRAEWANQPAVRQQHVRYEEGWRL